MIDQEARNIWGTWSPSSSLEDAECYLIGPILGFALRLRGVTCLHANGMVIDGQALAVTGPSGAGKSTLAASFAATGHAILSDDVLPLKMQDGDYHAYPGYRRLWLFPNSYIHHQALPNDLPRLAPDWDKRYLDFTRHDLRFQNRSVPLRAIYIIDWSRQQEGYV